MTGDRMHSIFEQCTKYWYSLTTKPAILLTKINISMLCIQFVTPQLHFSDLPEAGVVPCFTLVSSPFQVLIPHRANVKVESIELLANFLDIFERKRTLQSVSVFKLSHGATPPVLVSSAKEIQFEEEVYKLTSGSALWWLSIICHLQRLFVPCFTSLFDGTFSMPSFSRLST